MLAQASIEALRTRFDASGLNGSESIYASRHGENDIAFVAIAGDGNITTYKSDEYPEDILDQEIITLCCTRYDDRLTHIPQEIDENNIVSYSPGLSRCILIELIVASIGTILWALFLLIYWLLLRDFENMLVVGGVTSLPIIFFILSIINARKKGSGNDNLHW